MGAGTSALQGLVLGLGQGLNQGASNFVGIQDRAARLAAEKEWRDKQAGLQQQGIDIEGYRANASVQSDFNRALQAAAQAGDVETVRALMAQAPQQYSPRAQQQGNVTPPMTTPPPVATQAPQAEPQVKQSWGDKSEGAGYTPNAPFENYTEGRFTPGAAKSFDIGESPRLQMGTPSPRRASLGGNQLSMMDSPAGAMAAPERAPSSATPASPWESAATSTRQRQDDIAARNLENQKAMLAQKFESDMAIAKQRGLDERAVASINHKYENDLLKLNTQAALNYKDENGNRPFAIPSGKPGVYTADVEGYIQHSKLGGKYPNAASTPENTRKAELNAINGRLNVVTSMLKQYRNQSHKKLPQYQTLLQEYNSLKAQSDELLKQMPAQPQAAGGGSFDSYLGSLNPTGMGQ